MPSLSMPVNINQNHDLCENTRRYGCTVSCATDVASYYGKASYTLADMREFGVYSNTNASCVWYKVPDVSFSSDVVKDNQSDYFALIKSEILASRPVLVHMTGSHNSVPYPHFVVAYGYSGSCDSNDKINVLDPYNSTGAGVYSNVAEGRYIMLSDAMSTEYATSIDYIKKTSKK